MNSTIHNQLLLQCEALSQAGLTPSVALVRAKATTKISLQQAIAVIQAYKSGERGSQNIENPNLNQEIEPIEELDVKALSAKVLKLEKQNSQLTSRVELLERQINQLLSRLTDQ